MRKAKRAALDVLAKSAEVYNCWSILDEAVTCGEDGGFTREYIEGEREMLDKAIGEALSALKALGARYGIDVEMWRDRAEDMRMERDELQAKLEEAEFAIANWREREKSFDTSERLREELRRERDELRERLDRVADALRGVERGTMSAWEAADEVCR